VLIEFTPLTEGDLGLVEEWLRREHVARWWRDDIGESLAEYRGAVEGREPTDHYLIVVDGRPVGMIQTYLVSDYPEWDEVVQVGPGVAGVDLMIGEADAIGRGTGVVGAAETGKGIRTADFLSAGRRCATEEGLFPPPSWSVDCSGGCDALGWKTVPFSQRPCRSWNRGL